MNVLLVTYDLKVPGRDYTSLYASLKTATNWWHYLDSTWLIYTNESPEIWSNRLHAFMDKNDALFIVDISKQKRQGWLTQSAWDWVYKFMD